MFPDQYIPDALTHVILLDMFPQILFDEEYKS
jgi:hypothetical protein